MNFTFLVFYPIKKLILERISFSFRIQPVSSIATGYELRQLAARPACPANGGFFTQDSGPIALSVSLFSLDRSVIITDDGGPILPNGLPLAQFQDVVYLKGNIFDRLVQLPYIHIYMKKA